MNQHPNLKPFTGANDPRRQNGRTKGSKNVSTIVRNLLEQEIPLRAPNLARIREITNSQKPSHLSAIVAAMIIKATDGDVNAAKLLFNLCETADQEHQENTGFFNTKQLKIVSVSSSEELEQLDKLERLKDELTASGVDFERESSFDDARA